MRKPIFIAALTLSLLQVSGMASVVDAADVSSPGSPFVIGFERFCRPDLAGPTNDDTTVSIEGGRLLISELSCTACHHSADASLRAKRGPVLAGVGNRINSPWVRRFLQKPSEAKPGTTMPDVLHHLAEDQRAAAIEALVAFLQVQQQPFPVVKGSGLSAVPFEFWSKGDAKVGRKLYHTNGCVACHQAEANYETAQYEVSATDRLINQFDPDELEEMGLSEAARPVTSIPLPSIAQKYNLKSLTHFLLDPALDRPAGRMPNLKLSPVEAADIAAYLMDLDSAGHDPAATNVETPTAELIQAGRRLFRETGCVNCHDLPDMTGMTGVPSKPLHQLRIDATTSCVSRVGNSMPDFGLDVLQSSAIIAALQNLNRELTPAALITHTLRQLNCLACHERDERGGVGRFRKAYFETIDGVDIGDEGRLPPSLTSAGRKLQPQWFMSVLQGQGTIRPHMTIRMPVYPSELTKPLPPLFATVDQVDHSDVVMTKEPHEAGRLLMDIGCVQCHSFRGESLPGVVGIDLAGTTSRVQPAWFLEFLSNPGNVKKRTRMPNFFPDGISQDRELLDGDPARQIAAMWSYLKQVEQGPLPQKIETARAQNYELVPKERPIVIRTFMPDAGTHAIAVGFPQSIHYAFDAEQLRLAEAWKGRFLDAQGTWFIRFAPPAPPLGESVIQFPAGVPFAALSSPQEAWPTSSAEALGYRFEGYRLDAMGVPTFLYRIDRDGMGVVQIEDTTAPDQSGALVRTLRLQQSTVSAPTLYFRAAAGEQLRKDGAGVRDSAGLLTTVSMEPVVENGNLLVPISPSAATTITVKYQW
jgi:cytochrome c553